MSHLIEGANKWLRHSGEPSDTLTYKPLLTHTQQASPTYPEVYSRARE